MNIHQDGQQLITEHNKLYKLLLNIPLTRPIYYREDIEDCKTIGKPRFVNRRYSWSNDSLLYFHNHLQNIWIFFEKYSFWFDSFTKELLYYEDRSISNKSVKFLLERDVWETAEVYGAYLIEEENSQTVISYYRFKSRVKTFIFPKMHYEDRKKWIIQDAIRQIKTQFSFLWDHLLTEIEVCINEELHKHPPVKIYSSYLEEQLLLATDNKINNPELSLLILGRMSELWLLQALNIEKTDHLFLVSEAKQQKLLRNSDALFFSRLRRHYNRLKHSLTYNVLNCPLDDLIDKFKIFLESKPNPNM